MTNSPIYRQAFGALYEDIAPTAINNIAFYGWYRVTIDGWFSREFSAPTRAEAIRMFKEGAA